MAHFYFEYRCEDSRVEDPVGKDLPDLRAAYDHALSLIGRVISLRVTPSDEVGEWRGWAVDVMNAEKSCALTVLFSSRTMRRSRPQPRWPAVPTHQGYPLRKV